MKGCLKELKRLRKHYKKEFRISKSEYVAGIIDGLDLAIEVVKNKEFYGDIE